MAAGIVAISIARHLRIPGIVVLLATGVLLGPDALNVIRPQVLDGALHTLVGFAVAVILFEGGMNLNLQRLRREARSIRQLVTLGALITLLGGTWSARWILGWDWVPSFLFGSLVIVTGPTVITPLLRRIKVQRKVATVLEAEGILVDAIGAIFAAVALQFAVQPSGQAAAFAAYDLLLRLGLGIALGLVGGLAIAYLLRRETTVPEGLENVFTLALAFALFHFSNAIFTESGIMTVTMAGLVVGNVRTRALPDLLEFKEQLTVMLIGMLFVLLAADVRLQDIAELGSAGVWTVVSLMFLVRPLNIFLGTLGSDLTFREKLFLCWLAPRGIVAAAGASLFVETLDHAGMQVGTELRALVFLVIASTVLVQGLTGGFVAGLLGVRRKSDEGYAILGGNHLGRAFMLAFRDAGIDSVLIESNPETASQSQEEGFRVIFGNGLRDTTMARAEMGTRAGSLALTTNEAVNLLFSKHAKEDFGVKNLWTALRRGHTGVTPEMVHEIGARVLFGEPRFIDLWTIRLERGLANVEVYERQDDVFDDDVSGDGEFDKVRRLHKALLPLMVKRGSKVRIFDERIRFRRGDRLYVVVFSERRKLADEYFREHGWVASGTLAGVTRNPIAS